jgi:hypothetical protein
VKTRAMKTRSMTRSPRANRCILIVPPQEQRFDCFKGYNLT